MKWIWKTLSLAVGIYDRTILVVLLEKTGSWSELVLWYREGSAHSFFLCFHNTIIFFAYDVKLLKSVLSLIVGVWAKSGLAVFDSTLALCWACWLDRTAASSLLLSSPDCDISALNSWTSNKSTQLFFKDTDLMNNKEYQLTLKNVFIQINLLLPRIVFLENGTLCSTLSQQEVGLVWHILKRFMNKHFCKNVIHLCQGINTQLMWN
jgi:hypothetical protein